jgi:hypothetical protein
MKGNLKNLNGGIIMKKLLSVVFVLTIMLSALSFETVATAKNVTYKSKGCIYTLDKKGNATVINYDYFHEGYWKIPSKLDGHKVTKVDYKREYISLDKVKIPATVTSITSKLANAIRRERNIDGTEVRIVCYKGSYAQKYAIKNKINYIISGDHKTRGHLEELFLHYGYKIYDADGKAIKYGDKLPSKVFNGKAQKAAFTLKKDKFTLKLNRDYTVKYVNYYSIGTVSIVIKGKGDYFGAIALYYDIVPTQAKIKEVTKESDDSVYINYLHQKSMGQQIIEYSTEKNFKNSKNISLDIYDKPIINNLEKGNTYYFRIRNYYQVANGLITVYYDGTYEMQYGCTGYQNIYGKWSNVKSIKL